MSIRKQMKRCRIKKLCKWLSLWNNLIQNTSFNIDINKEFIYKKRRVKTAKIFDDSK